MKLVVGLGNPEEKYTYTFHNMGFLAVDVLTSQLNFKLSEKTCDSLVGVKSVNGEKLIVAKPLTYMNLSGKAVKQLLARYKVSPEDLIVIYDDIDIGKGTIRYREKGSAGTHNGMRNIISEIGTENFKRIRIGTGPIPEGIPLIAYVLNTIPDEERSILAEACREACEKVKSLL